MKRSTVVYVSSSSSPHHCDPEKAKLWIFDDIYLYTFSKKMILRPPAWDLISSPGAPETKHYFYFCLTVDVWVTLDDEDVRAMQKVCHSLNRGGGLKNCHFAMTNEPLVTLLRGERGYEISIFSEWHSFCMAPPLKDWDEKHYFRRQSDYNYINTISCCFFLHVKRIRWITGYTPIWL